MNDLNSFDKAEYEKAGEIRVKEHQSFRKQVFFLFQIAFMLIQEFVLYLISFFRKPEPKNISAQLCLVTGGANGLGRCLALKFAEQKCRIVIVDVLNTDETVKEIIETYGVDCKGFKCDISDFEALKKLKNEIENSMGTVDILVNNAGVLFGGTLDSYSIESIQRCVAINLTSHFLTVKLFLPQMIEKKHGKIIAISSMFAKMPGPLTTVYSATKYGVDGFMEALFDDLCLDDNEKHVKLTTVFPYFINTRKQLCDMMDEVEDVLPRLTPEFVAQKVINGVLKGKTKIIITPFLPMIFIQLLPERVIKFAKISTNKTKIYKERHYSEKNYLK